MQHSQIAIEHFVVFHNPNVMASVRQNLPQISEEVSTSTVESVRGRGFAVMPADSFLFLLFEVSKYLIFPGTSSFTLMYLPRTSKLTWSSR